jgi:uncharacterized alkaline shock family protein YloU
MAETKVYLTQAEENGMIFISEEVIASIAASAVREVEGVYGLCTGTSLDLGNIIGRKNLRKGIRVQFREEGFEISCNLVVKMGSAVVSVAKAVQETIVDEITAMTGSRPLRVNVNVSGIAVYKTEKQK